MSKTLVVGVVVSGWPVKVVPAEFWKCYERLAARLREGPCGITRYEKVESEGFPVDVARNQIVRYAIGVGADELLFLDADHVFQPDLYERLASHAKPVITARYHVKRPPHHPNAYVAHPLSPAGQFKTVHYGAGCFEIDRGGAGALLIQRPVLEAIGEDWFRYQRNPNPGEPPDFSVSEDFWFYEQAQRCGYSCWCDWETEVQHLAVMPIGGDHHRAYLELMEQEMTPELAAQLVACGFSEPIMRGGYLVRPHRSMHSEATA